MRNCPETQIAGRRRIRNDLNRAKTARVLVVLTLGTVGSVPLVILTPPFQVPDEVQHFYRAFELSELRIRAEVQNGISGGTLPDSLPELVKSSVETTDGVYYPPTPSPISKTLKLASIPLNGSARRFYPFPGSAYYSPLPYSPQVLGITVGRLFGAGPLYLLYLGRLFNCLASLALVGFAVYLMPVAAELVMVVGLLPMSLFLYASLSPDAAVIACALLFSALSFSASARGDWRTWELATAAAAAAVFCSVKPVYIPITLAGIVPGIFRPGQAARVIRAHGILLAVALGVAAGWLLFAKSTMTSPLGGGHPSLQLSVVLHHPAVFMRAVAHTLEFGVIRDWYRGAVGWFGWLTVQLQPHVVNLLPMATFLIVWKIGGGDHIERPVLCALWYLALAVASSVLVITALYLMSAQVGQDRVTGVQGRYFIPILVLAGMAAVAVAPGRRPSATRWASLAALATLIGVEILAMYATIIVAFRVF
jgi:uncharacterized membrane protein